jgi:acetyltransferase-like isoleucine patch superfamily enzyme
MIQISIIIATWNAGKVLDNCLQSIIPQLSNETELIIVDGLSSDNTKDIIAQYHDYIAYTVSEKDKGIYDAWNKGIRVARGKWLAFIGADDILLEGAIQRYLTAIKETGDIDSYDYICAHNEYVDMNGKLLKLLGDDPQWSIFRRTMNAAHVASLHNRKNLFETVGEYNLDFKICADYELLMRKKSKLKALFLDARIARMKVGGMSFSTRAIVETYKIRKLHHSLPIVMNELSFLRDWLAFKFFIFRKTLRGGNLANFILSKAKGEEFLLDDCIPLGYIIKLFASKFFFMLYGMIRLRTLTRVFVDPSAKIICGSNLHFGKNLNIGYGCYINALSKRGIFCGDNVSMGFHTYIVMSGSLHNIADRMVIGNNVGLGTHGSYGVGVGSLEIGDNTICGNYVSIHPENHITDSLDVPIRLQGVKSNGGVKIGKNCWIGAKATILDGTRIGDGCVVAAGAVVKGDFPDNCIIGGVPARILKMRS